MHRMFMEDLDSGGQTNSILLIVKYLSGLERRSEPAITDRLTTDRRILYFLTESVWPSSAVPSQRKRTDRRILYFLTESVWPTISHRKEVCEMAGNATFRFPPPRRAEVLEVVVTTKLIG